MKKIIVLSCLLMMLVILGGFTIFHNEPIDDFVFDIDNLYDYQKEFESKEIEVCADSTAKTYMDYRMTNVVSSRQYQFIRNELKVDKNTGFLYDEDGFIAVALGSYYGTIGDRYYFTLENGIVLPLVKAEAKADEDTDYTGCYHAIDSSIIEFVVDDEYAYDYFGGGNGLVLNGNYNNYPLFEGKIIKVEEVSATKKIENISYYTDVKTKDEHNDFYYASGY